MVSLIKNHFLFFFKPNSLETTNSVGMPIAKCHHGKLPVPEVGLYTALNSVFPFKFHSLCVRVVV